MIIYLFFGFFLFLILIRCCCIYPVMLWRHSVPRLKRTVTTKVQILVSVGLLPIHQDFHCSIPHSYHKGVQERQGLIALFFVCNVMLPVVPYLLRSSVSSSRPLLTSFITSSTCPLLASSITSSTYLFHSLCLHVAAAVRIAAVPAIPFNFMPQNHVRLPISRTVRTV